ncbi:MAG: prepilin-type N-terminal cleavage/methylation domain-containing protein [Phycisphaeraceae bacterium]|nr:prepilin-type N-terminal cleavage/methylation domain-containing protein [Phycisphaeraceae bacterium]
MPTPRHGRSRGFTLIELLVVISIIALLIGILIPSLGAARDSARSLRCGTNLNQIGVALSMYIPEHREALPQVRIDPGTNEPVEAPNGFNIGSLFGGKKGLLPVYGINTVGADRRPLNAYLGGGFGPDDEVEYFSDPSDGGTTDPFLSFFPFIDPTSTMYDLVGTSYNLNDHAPDTDPMGEIYPTLIPPEGGIMPPVANTSRTWVCGDQPIYNFDDGGDRGQRWHHGKVQANLLFLDNHVGLGLPVPEGPRHTTEDYTFLPTPDWLEQFTP